MCVPGVMRWPSASSTRSRSSACLDASRYLLASSCAASTAGRTLTVMSRWVQPLYLFPKPAEALLGTLPVLGVESRR